MVLKLFLITLFYLLKVVPSGADGGASAEASGPATQKALPPWMLRQGITSTSTAPGGQPLGPPFMQANGAGVGSTNDAIASEKDQKEIEVVFGTLLLGRVVQHAVCVVSCRLLPKRHARVASSCACDTVTVTAYVLYGRIM